MVKRILESKVMPWLSLLTGLIVTIFIMAVILIHTDFFAANTGRLLSRFMFGGTDFSLSIDEMGGNSVSNIELRGVVIRYRGEEFSFDLLRVDRIRMEYNLVSVFQDNPSIHELILDNPRVWLKPDSTGNQILPWGEGDNGTGGFPRFTVGRLEIDKGQVIVQGREKAEVVKEISMICAVNSTSSEVSLDVVESSATSVRGEMSLEKLTGRINVIRKDSWEKPEGRQPGYQILLSGLRVELEDSRLSLDGRINPDPLDLGISVNASPANIAELADVVGIETSHRGEIEGKFLLRGRPDSLQIEGNCHGVFSGYAMENLTTRLYIDESGIRVMNVDGQVNGISISGSAFYSLNEPETFYTRLGVNEMDLSRGVVQGVDLPPTNFNGELKLTYLPGSEDLTFNFELGEGHLDGLPFNNGFFSAEYSGGVLSIERLMLSDQSHWMDSHGKIWGKDSLRVFFEVKCEKDDTLFSYFDIQDYRADVNLNCVWQGNLDSWKLRASGSCQRLDYSHACVDSGGIKLVIDKKDSYGVLFDLEADSCEVGSYGFGGMNLSLDYLNGVTQIKKLYLEKKDLNLDIIARVVNRNDSTIVDMEELSMNALGEKWLGGGEFSVVSTDSLVQFRDLQLHSRKGAVYLDGRFDRGDSLLDGELEVERLDMALLNRAEVAPDTLGGQGRGVFKFSGPLDSPDISAHFGITGGWYDTLQVDSLEVAGEWRDKKLLLDSLIITTPRGYVRGGGEIVGVDTGELYRRGAEALEQSISRLSFHCEGMEISPILGLMEQSRPSQGYFSGNIILSDSTFHPRLRLDGTISEMYISSVYIPAVEVNITADRNALDLEGTVHISQNSTGSLKGYIPLKKKNFFYKVDRDRDFSLQLEIAQSDFGNAPELTRFIAESSGGFSMNLGIAGRWEQPSINGEFILDDAALRLSGMGEYFHQVNSRITLDDSVVSIEKMEGKEGKEGEFECRGNIFLRGWKPEKYQLRASLDNILITSVPDIMAGVSGDLTVGMDTLAGGKIVPLIGGQLEVKRGEIYYDLNDFSSEQGSATMAPPSWVASVDLDIPGNVWLKTPDAKIELQGEVTLNHDQRGDYLRGRLRLLRGWYNVYNNKFHIKSGELDFVHARGFRPVVDIQAETRDPQGKKIYLNLVWNQDDVEPRLSLSHEDPGYSETDIWKMLGGGVVASSEEGSTSWDAVSTAQNLAANYIERVLNSQMEGVTIEVESAGGKAVGGSFEEEETMIAVGKYLSEGLYVKYKQGLSISSAKQIEVEYRISDLFLIRSQIIRYSEKALKSESQRAGDEVNVDIKLRWEF